MEQVNSLLFSIFNSIVHTFIYDFPSIANSFTSSHLLSDGYNNNE